MATSYTAAISLSTPAPPRPLRVMADWRRLFGVGARNWCHFTVPLRPRTRTPIQLGAPASYDLAYASEGLSLSSSNVDWGSVREEEEKIV
jgi:hypothetical protein